MPVKPSKYLGVAILLIVLGLIAFGVWRSLKPSPYTAFAQCLTDKGVKMYGAWWCPHCAAQKQVFGNAFKKITYIECSPNGTKEMSAECKAAGIEGYPTWVFSDGTKTSGEQTTGDLARASGCQLPPQ